MKSLIIIFSLLLSFNLSAQWRIGGRVGGNWTKKTDMPSVSGVKKLRMGFDLAAVSNYSLNQWLELQGELAYSQRGFYDYISVCITEPEGTYNMKIATRHLDIPLALKVYPFKKAECFNVLVGIQPGVYLSDSFKGDKYLEHTYGEFAPFNFGFLFGLAYNFEQGFFIDTRYLLNTTKIYKQFGRMKERSIQLSVGYLFRL